MDIRFGTWNVISLYRAGSPKTVASELAKYNLDIVVEREVRWDKGGSKPADTFLYGNGNANPHTEDGFCKKPQRVFHQFPKYHMTILLGFNEKVGREIFKPAIGNESLHEISNDNGVKVINVTTLQNQIVKSNMFPHRNVYNIHMSDFYRS
jgi:hypothetical protein